MIKAFIVICLGVWGVVSCTTSESWQESRRLDEIERQKRMTPHVIKEFDGCKLYAFERQGRDHYITRCPSSKTTTDKNYTENCGKSCTRNLVETIETQDGQ
jgi:hypothetical protein